MTRGQIKVKAFGVLRRDDAFLLSLYRDHSKQERFARPLGGHVEFLEASADTLVREFREEIDADVQLVALLGWLENPFVHEGAPGHEVIAVYEVRFSDPALYDVEQFELLDDPACEGVVWLTPQEMAHDAIKFYPVGLLGLLAAQEGNGS